MSSKPRRPDRRRVITIGSSSKKAGKSTLASHLVRELGAQYGLKVSSGGEHASKGVISDPGIIATPGTDTGALVEAGAKLVLWVNAPPSELAEELDRALAMLPDEGILVVEGNSAHAHFEPDFAVFLMNAPFDAFKPSALIALERADLVLVNLAGELSGTDVQELRRKLSEHTPLARVVFFGKDEMQYALLEASRLARELTMGTDTFFK